MNAKFQLLVNMLFKGVLGFSLLGLLLFSSAGTVHYQRAWLFLAVLAILMLAMGLVLLVKHPETLERRLKSKEERPAQKIGVAITGTLFVSSFIVAGLDYRFGWSKMPNVVSYAGLVVMLAGYVLYSVVIFQNSYASRVVEIEKEQTLITTGLYAVVRHPMYSAALAVFLPVPLVLGSYAALFPMLAFPVSLFFRVKDEELMLMSGLKGYSDYVKKTRYRLIPFIW